MKAETGYIIVDVNGKYNLNSFRHQKGRCINSWLKNAPFDDWEKAKKIGYKCKNITLNFEFVS